MLREDRMEPRFPLVAPSLDLRKRLANLGMAMAARMPMMATTIISSMRGKPGDAPPRRASRFVITFSSLRGFGSALLMGRLQGLQQGMLPPRLMGLQVLGVVLLDMSL